MSLLTEIELNEVIEKIGGKRVAFCHAYMRDYNASRAARDVGYSKITAHTTGYVLLRDENVKKYVDHLKEMRKLAFDVDAELILEELKNMAFASQTDFLTEDEYGGFKIKSLTDIDESAKSAIKKIKVSQKADPHGNVLGNIVELEMHDKKASLELLGKYLNLFKETVSLQNNGDKFDAAVPTFIINHRNKNEDLE